MNHEVVEKNVGVLAVFIVLVISVAGLVQIVPLFFLNETTQAHEGVEPYPPLEFAGRDIYVREGCYNCHSQMVRPFRAETERYGHYSLASEFVYDRPFQWGSKRTGPDLHRVGGRYTDEWHRVHLMNPRDVLPNSNMPAYPWLAARELNGEQVAHRMRMQQRFLGVPYNDDMIESAADELEGKTEMDAVIAYLQGLGTAIERTR
ncbi:cytochrome-c oxidase, cbb3-type subunit II [Alkalilimnicola ehrlichii MLHE-1]|uniref:Cytochrome c oxidase, cbb3-type, subunit II n=1 Tax=Alkalilimnicola ehrlichii (strain ATCC BAA-1101 / DSM 17681 / MLHE-1) TaxID=187272 RepID=Q0A7G2_ALKEH|nr:cytochrome-c oxidase, cbb3-type subunit II [Alkalilimnicola ehrlichii]ABI57225.1 cytochrome c oxidase, cbb3-type, subunit II [Alkalilimnicola ehrlichii MLHE-1]